MLPKSKAPPFGEAFAQIRPELAIGFSLLAGLWLPALLLLTRFRLPTTLLTRLLVGVLGLLARILIRIAHSRSPLLNAAWNNLGRVNLVAEKTRGSGGNIGGHRRSPLSPGNSSKNNPVQADLVAAHAVAARGSELLENATTR